MTLNRNQQRKGKLENINTSSEINSFGGLGQYGDMCDLAHTTDSTAVSAPDIRQLFHDPDRISREAVRTVFNLEQHETQTYLALVDHPQSTANDLAEILDRHPRHVASVLLDLLDTGLVVRVRRILDGGGNVYIYQPAPLPVTKQILHEELDAWAAAIRAEIDTLGTPATSEGQDSDSNE